MKKFILGLATLLLIAGSMSAQADGEKLLKKAKRALGTYNLDVISNVDKLMEAKDFVDQAFATGVLDSNAKAYLIKGQIYNEFTNNQIISKSTDLTGSFVFTDKEAGITAMTALEKAYELAEKKFQKAEAIKSAQEAEGHIYNMSIIMLQDEEYAVAFKNYEALNQLGAFLQSNGKATKMDDAASFNEIIYYTGVSAYYGGDCENAIPYFEQTVARKDTMSFAYEALFNCYKDTDDQKAADILSKGRIAFPDDTRLLYAEINFLLGQGRLHELIDKLKLAREKEPGNVSVHTTLGSVYDNLQAKSLEAGDLEKAAEHFDLAKDWYGKAIEIDSTGFEALYSMGALYNNKAAGMTEDINKYANDFSAEGGKMYEKLKAEMDGLFDKAFPYFEASEAANPTDLNTLIAIKEIHARRGNFDKTAEYKAIIEAIQAGK